MAGLSHKDTILIWNDAVLTLDKGPQHYDAALQTLQSIENPSAKILFNIGHINLSTGHVKNAVEVSLRMFKMCFVFFYLQNVQPIKILSCQTNPETLIRTWYVCIWKGKFFDNNY